MKRYWIAAVALTIGALPWLAWSSVQQVDADDGNGASPDAAPTPDEQAAPLARANSLYDGHTSPPVSREAQRTATSGRGTVRVRVTGLRAGTATGSVLARSDRSTETFARVPSDAPFRATLAEGMSRIEVDCNVATRLLIHDQATGVRRHVRVDPFAESTDVLVDLDPDQVVVHLLVLDCRLARPIPGCDVVVEQVGALSGTVLARSSTDASGEATVRVKAGELSFRTEHASPIDATPWRRTLQVAPNCEAAESFLILATPPRRHTLRMDVHVASVGQGDLAGPRLFLRNMEGGDVVPLPHRLRCGSQLIEADAFEGTYDVEALPFGQVDVICPEGPIVVGGRTGSSEPRRVNVSSRMDRTLVTLRSVTRDEFPLRVTLRDPAACPSVGQELYVFGPMSWHLPTQSVPRWSGRKQVVVFSRRRALLSRAALDCVGGALDVDLAPATLVHVRCPSEGASGATLTVECDGSSLVVPLRLDVVRDNLVDRPALVADVVVPHGSATFDCGVEDRLMWRKTVTLATAAEALP